MQKEKGREGIREEGEVREKGGVRQMRWGSGGRKGVRGGGWEVTEKIKRTS